MGKIRLLSSSVYNKIAAGEVIENPASIVKELVENSIDAGARKISIDIVNGGMDSITVTDNGHGMDEEDVAVALVKHATSKLYCADDLFDIQTMGFRGEALASISAVSRMAITTRSNSIDMAIRITAENSEITSTTRVSSNVGTTVEVRDLFYNVPARKNFIKSPQHEGTEITRYVSKLILTAPYLDVRYTLDGKEIYHNAGGNLENAIFTVYGGDCLKNCLNINAEYKNMRIFGYVGSPDYTKANTTYQTLSVNGRYVTDKNISSAIMQAFKSYLMVRQYPFYVLNIDVPFSDVDVNVHPRKMEVRFSNNKTVFSAFYNAINIALENYTNARVDGIVNGEVIATFASSETQEEPQKPKKPEVVPISLDDLSHAIEYSEPISLASVIDENTNYRYISVDFSEPKLTNQDETIKEIEHATSEAVKTLDFCDYANFMGEHVTIEKLRKSFGMDRKPGEKVSQEDLDSIMYRSKNRFIQSELFDPAEVCGENGNEYEDPVDTLISRTSILGCAFKTYLIFELDGKIMFIDQHAAHERILFDSYMKKSKLHDIETLLLPYVFTVHGEEEQFIEDNLQNICDVGIIIEPFGEHTYRINALAMLFKGMPLKSFVDYILSNVDEFKLDDKKLVVDRLARRACRTAVKAGYTLNEMEIEYILRKLMENKSLQCPHGRPIAVIFTKAEFEKMFKRTV